MTDLTARLDAIQKRAEDATPGPWEYMPCDIYPTWILGKPKEGSPYAIDVLRVDDEDYCGGLDAPDAVFIAAAPDDIAFLLDLTRKQQAAIDAVVGYMENRAQTLRRTADGLMQQVLDRHPDRDHDAAIRYEHYALEAASGVAKLREALEAKP